MVKNNFKNVEHHLVKMDKIFDSFSEVLNILITNMVLLIQELD